MKWQSSTSSTAVSRPGLQNPTGKSGAELERRNVIVEEDDKQDVRRRKSDVDAVGQR